MIIKKLSYLFLLTLSPLTSVAQSLDGLNNYLQKTRVGLVDEFIDRFNGKITHPDIPRTQTGSRKKNLLILFDLSQFKSKNDAQYKEAEKMADAVIKNNVKIHYADATWTALAHCNGTLHGKTVKFDLYLTVESRGKDMYKWVITNAKGNIFQAEAKNKKGNIMLYPDDHETNFISLHRMTSEQPYNVVRFMEKDFYYDTASVFAYMVHSGQLKIDYVDDLEFVFTQVPGYIFHIRYFQREKSNAGWLISKFYKTTPKEKTQFLNSLHRKKH